MVIMVDVCQVLDHEYCLVVAFTGGHWCWQCVHRASSFVFVPGAFVIDPCRHLADLQPPAFAYTFYTHYTAPGVERVRLRSLDIAASAPRFLRSAEGFFMDITIDQHRGASTAEDPACVGCTCV